MQTQCMVVVSRICAFLRSHLRLILLGTLAFLPFPAFSQTTAGIVGTVSDPTGAGVSGCSVTVTNQLTGFSRTVQTGPDGAYVETLLPVGTYRVKASAPNFATSMSTDITLSVQQTAKVDLQLKIGATTQVLEVQSTSPLVDTEQASVGQVMDKTRMVELPINGRSPASLLVLIPGVENVSPASGPTDLTLNLNAGGRLGQNNFYLDNARYNSVQYGEGNPLPPPDFLEEFRVTQDAYDAEKGLASATTVQVLTKSGTNGFHGDVWEFHRDNALNATDEFATTKPFLVQNQFGGTLGGPIRKNKTFFFVGYQGTRIRASTVVNPLVPTAAERNGDFSQSSVVPNDPLTGAPFSSGMIPQNRWDQGAINYLGVVPVANSAGGRFSANLPSDDTGDELILKIDHKLFRNNQLSARYWFDNGRSAAIGSGNLPFGTYQFGLTWQNFVLVDTHTLSSSLLNVFTAMYNRKYNRSENSDTPFQSPQDAGVNLPNTGFKNDPPAVNVQGYFGMGPGIAGVPLRLDNDYEINDTVTWVKGRSTWKFGVDWLPTRFGPDQAALNNGIFSFNGEFTGNAFADFLLGRPSALTDYYELDYTRNFFLSTFVQNDYRVSRKLTLNLGLRYQYEQPVYQPDGLTANFIPGFHSTRFPNAPAGMGFYRDPGIPKGLADSDFNDFDPRIGIAWDLFGDGKTSLRAGFGVFHQPNENGNTEFANLNQPFLTNLNTTSVNSFSQPFPGGVGGFGVDPNNPASQYNPITGQAVFVTPVSMWAVDPHRRNAYVENYSTSIQHQFTSDFGLEADYIGSAGRKLVEVIDANPAPYQPGATLANVEQRRLYSPGEISSVSQFRNGANSSFNALALVAKKRFSHSYLMEATYTWSKSTDDQSDAAGYVAANTFQNPLDPSADYALSDFNRSQVFSLSWVWDLPALNSSPGLVKGLIGGWQFTGLFHAATGMPFTVLTGADNSRTGEGRDRPDTAGNPNATACVPGTFFNTCAFVPNAIGSFGDTGRNSLIGPRMINTDIGLFKNVSLAETRRLQFRLELFNLLNHPNFGQPDSNLIDPNFGRILRLASGAAARQIQVAMKFIF